MTLTVFHDTGLYFLHIKKVSLLLTQFPEVKLMTRTHRCLESVNSLRSLPKDLPTLQRSDHRRDMILTVPTRLRNSVARLEFKYQTTMLPWTDLNLWSHRLPVHRLRPQFLLPITNLQTTSVQAIQVLMAHSLLEPTFIPFTAHTIPRMDNPCNMRHISHQAALRMVLIPTHPRLMRTIHSICPLICMPRPGMDQWLVAQ
jgi:hypothetical protein